MFVVFGVTSGRTSRVFEGRYKGDDDVRDVHESGFPRMGGGLRSFEVVDDPKALVLWSFDIPGYETRIYSEIKEWATRILCPRVDNSTYLLPDISLLDSLGPLAGDDARSVVYYVRPLDREFVNNALRDTLKELKALIARDVGNLLRARGAAVSRIVSKLSVISDETLSSAKLWVDKGFDVDLNELYALAGIVETAINLKTRKSQGLTV
ncbi:MAG: hypothetical protein ACP5GY_05995 [Vulcanisaeta sp.]